MASLYRRLLIVLLLITAFAGRIGVYAIAASKPVKMVLKEYCGKSEKPGADEDDEQVEEKIKLEDIIFNGLTNIDFMGMANTKTRLFPGDYRLVKCTLQTLEYPPK